MEQYILAKYDISGSQSYLFASNLLRENVSAPNGGRDILKEVLPDALNDWAAAVKGKVITDWEGVKDGTFLMEDEQELLAEVLYIGGGKAFIIYRNQAFYDEAGRQFSVKATENYQIEEVLTVSVDVHLNNFPGDITRLNQRMGELPP